MSINRLLELHDLAKQETRKYDHKRFLFPQLMHPRNLPLKSAVQVKGGSSLKGCKSTAKSCSCTALRLKKEGFPCSCLGT